MTPPHLRHSSSDRQWCPDGGTCHHDCHEYPGMDCWRVHNHEPLSGVFANDEWPTPLPKRGGPIGGVELIAAERARQVSDEGWTPEHDDCHTDGALALAAACYAMPERLYVERRNAHGPAFVDPWPWADHDDKRKDGANHPNAIPTDVPARIDMLVRAGALIAAEIDRLHRKDWR